MLLGLKKPSEAEIYADHDRRMRSLFFDPIEKFPDKIDQLLVTIDKVCEFSCCLKS